MSQYLSDNGRLSRFASNGYRTCVRVRRSRLIKQQSEISRQVGVPCDTSLTITEKRVDLRCADEKKKKR